MIRTVSSVLLLLTAPTLTALVGSAKAADPRDEKTLELSLSQLKDPNPFVRGHGAFVLGLIPEGSKDLAPKLARPLLEALADHDETVRQNAALALGRLGPAAASCVPALIEALGDEFGAVRSNAAAAVGAIGANPEKAVPRLIEALGDPDAVTRRATAGALGRFGPRAASAVPALSKALKDSSRDVRINCAWAPGEIQAKEVVPRLLEALGDKDDEVRQFVVRSLAALRPDAKQAVPALAKLVKDDSSPAVRYTAVDMLRLHGKSAVPALVELLGEADDLTRYYACWGLGVIGPEAKAAVPDLTKALKDRDAKVRRRAAAALGGIGPGAKEAVTALVECLRHEDKQLQRRAHEALKLIDPEFEKKGPDMMRREWMSEPPSEKRVEPSFTWQSVTSGYEGPGPRSRHCLVHERGRRVTVLFGGIVWGGPDRLESDCWELKGGSWSRSDALPRPPARHRGAMAYDDGRGFSVLFGGQGNSGEFLGDTWIHADGNWRQRRTWSWRRPAPRAGHAMTFDEGMGVVVLFGGIDRRHSPLGDTWLFDGGRWQRVVGHSPPPRRYAALAYDPALQGCVLHGGAVDDAGHHLFDDTWLFRDRTWTRLPSSFETDPLDDHGMAYHRSAQMLLLLEGINGARGIMGRASGGWQRVDATPLHPRHQCSPLVWDEALGGLVLHGGETHHAGPQLDETLVLRMLGNS
jgi:HEAT repeat protein